MDIGPVFDVVFSPNFGHDRLCLAATVEGLLVSRDGGHSWARHPLFEGEVVTCLAISLSFAEDRTLLAGLPGGVLYSTDAGKSWTAGAFAVPGPPRLSALAFSPNYQRDGVALAGTIEDGIYRTADRARSWQPWNFGLLDLSVMCLSLSPAFEQDETVFAGTTTGLFRSRNGGLAWREVDMGREVSVISSAMSPDFAQDGTVFIGTEREGLFGSTDGGSSWQKLSSWGPEGPVNALCSTGDGTLLAASDAGVYLSRDAGQTWALWTGLPAPLCLAWSPGVSGSESVLAGTAEVGIWTYAPETENWRPARIVS